MRQLFLPALLCLVGTIAPAADEMYQESEFLAGYNRAMFKFNDGLDTAILKPVAKGYRAVTPNIVERGVANFFSNLGEIPNVINDLFQAKGRQAANDSGRFLINTTLGVAGFLDVAEKMGLEKADGEDFGQTLGAWGVASGSYLVLPFFGPSTFRDAPARVVDAFTYPLAYVEHVPTRNTLYVSNVVSDRAGLLDTEKLVSGDKYQFLKDAYLQRREYLVNDGLVEDDFGSYDDY